MMMCSPRLVRDGGVNRDDYWSGGCSCGGHCGTGSDHSAPVQEEAHVFQEIDTRRSVKLGLAVQCQKLIIPGFVFVFTRWQYKALMYSSLKLLAGSDCS